MEHYCQDSNKFPLEKYHQPGKGKGRTVLIVGESPAANGWRVSGKAFYTLQGKLLPSGKRLNELFLPLGLSVETCGFTELVKCFVGKERKKLFECGRGCWPILLKQLKSAEYKLIIVLGVETLRIFNELAMTHLVMGTISEASINNHKYAVLPIYHPSPINPHGQRKNRLIFEPVKEEINQLIGI